MGSSPLSSHERKVSNVVLRTLLTALFLVVLRIFQLVKFHNTDTGMLTLSTFSSVIDVIIVIALIYIAVEYAMISVYIKKLMGSIRLKAQPMLGLSLVIVSVCFFIQGITDILSSFSTPMVNKITPVISVFTVLSSISYAVRGFGMVWNKVRFNLLLNIIPILWSILVIINIMWTHPVVISIQSNTLKMICMILVMVFMYYSAKLSCGYDDKTSKSCIPMFFQISFSLIVIVLTLPYGIVFLFGIKDDILNLPYLAIIGLGIHGFLVTMQYMVLSIIKLEKIQHRK